MNKINIIQFLPYFPPHKGGLETVAEELSYFYVKNNFGEVINVIFDGGQDTSKIEESLLIKNKSGKKIGYYNNWYKVYLLPSFDIISNFPVPKFWKKIFWEILFLPELRNGIIQTHTRFFLSSFLGGVFSKITKQKWVHIEHGSDYVKLSSNLKSKISYLYDRVIGKWIFLYADKVVAISEACKKFIQKEFVKREIEVIYRGILIPENIVYNENIKEVFDNKIIIGFIGRLYKWKNVEAFIQAYYLLDNEIKEKIQVIIVGDGEDFSRLKKMDTENKIYFTGGKDFGEALSYQKQFDIHIHSSSSGGGLATTLLQAMYLGCFIVATPYEGAKEVITQGESGVLIEDDSIEEIKKGIEDALKNFSKKEEFALSNKKVIKEKFDWERNIREYFSLYNKF